MFGNRLGFSSDDICPLRGTGGRFDAMACCVMGEVMEVKLVKLRVLDRKTGKGAAKQLGRRWTDTITAILHGLIY